MDFLRKQSVAYTIAIIIVVFSTRHLFRTYSETAAVEVEYYAEAAEDELETETKDLTNQLDDIMEDFIARNYEEISHLIDFFRGEDTHMRTTFPIGNIETGEGYELILRFQGGSVAIREDTLNDLRRMRTNAPLNPEIQQFVYDARAELGTNEFHLTVRYTYTVFNQVREENVTGTVEFRVP